MGSLIHNRGVESKSGLVRQEGRVVRGFWGQSQKNLRLSKKMTRILGTAVAMPVIPSATPLLISRKLPCI